MTSLRDTLCTRQASSMTCFSGQRVLARIASSVCLACPPSLLLPLELQSCCEGCTTGFDPAKLAGARRVGFAVGTGPEGMACCRGGPQELCAYCGALGGGGLGGTSSYSFSQCKTSARPSCSFAQSSLTLMFFRPEAACSRSLWTCQGRKSEGSATLCASDVEVEVEILGCGSAAAGCATALRLERGSGREEIFDVCAVTRCPAVCI